MTEPLNEDQLKALHQKLLNLKAVINKQLDESKASADPVNLDEPIGRLSRMDAIQSQSIAKANRENLLLRSKQVDASLAEFKNSRYGLCRMCNRPIGYDRLNARPESPFCIRCQTEIEKKQRK